MRGWFSLLFILYPLLELVVLIKVGSAIGVLATLCWIVVTAFFGIWLLRLAGLSTAFRVREQLARGESPETEVLGGMLTAFGGLLLILPGFIGDVLGVLCVLPFTRDLLLAYLRRNAAARVRRRRAFADDPGAAKGPRRPDIIEGEYEQRDSGNHQQLK